MLNKYNFRMKLNKLIIELVSHNIHQQEQHYDKYISCHHSDYLNTVVKYWRWLHLTMHFQWIYKDRSHKLRMKLLILLEHCIHIQFSGSYREREEKKLMSFAWSNFSFAFVFELRSIDLCCVIILRSGILLGINTITCASTAFTRIHKSFFIYLGSGVIQLISSFGKLCNGYE